MGEKLGNYLGSFVMVDHGLNRDCLGSFLCIRVGLKISEPQKRCVTLRLALDELAKLYEIEYEWLPYFCLYCGRLDHVGSNCELKQTRDITMERYGSWKTMLKDVFCIRMVNDLTRNRVGLGGDETQLDNYASPLKVVGIVRPR
ncbi:unnamed protein product [Prunus armeniaca]|uniref:Zinc knuckle CX2CX4HX4C domain-containing protein n=1 Tax=Prunus armeniaca TaxID=36596 RepID=A0A6J5V428_PRUAR|nr:unnamed protein product [Prunus armeniaca]